MEDQYRLKDEPIYLTIPKAEYMHTALTLIVLATFIGIASQIVTLWLGDSIWMKAIVIMDGTLFGFATIILTELIGQAD